MSELFSANAGAALINIVLLLIMFTVAIAIARLRSLFAIVMLSCVYSLVSAAWYIAMDAVDVGYTEAAVGAGMTTSLLLGAMLLTARTAKPEKSLRRLGPFVICGATALLLFYATVDLPALGDADSPANQGVGMTYMQVNWYDMGVPNVVTSVLASYRGFDTMGEALVVFVAGLAVAMLLGFGERSLADTLRRNRVARRAAGDDETKEAAP